MSKPFLVQYNVLEVTYIESVCVFILHFLQHKYSFNIKSMQYLSNKTKTKIALQEKQKRGKLK